MGNAAALGGTRISALTPVAAIAVIWNVGAMQAELDSRTQFLRALAMWSIVFWAAVYGLLTARSLLMRPDLPVVSLAGLRALMVPVGLLLCAGLFVLLERIAKLDGKRKATAAALTVALATLLYFTVNYYVFHRFPDAGFPEPNAVIKILSYLVEFFWIFPAWVILYLFLRWRLRPAEQPRLPRPEGIWVKDRGSQILVPARSIRWIEAERDYARLHTEQGTYLVRSTMAALERQLAAYDFLRVHRRIIAPAPSIEVVSRARSGQVTVTLGDGTVLPAGRTYVRRLKRRLAARSAGA